MVMLAHLIENGQILHQNMLQNGALIHRAVFSPQHGSAACIPVLIGFGTPLFLFIFKVSILF